MAELTPYGSRLTPYRVVLRSRMRAQRSYPLSFAADMASSLLIGVTEFAEIWLLYHNVPALGGVDSTSMLLLFGLSNLCFALAQVAVGHTDTLPTYLRLGTLDAFHLRPQPLLLQLITSDISLRRLARATVAGVVLIIGLAINPIHWRPATIALLAISILSGIAIFAGLFICAAGLQFHLIDGSELTNTFTYGGSFAAQQPTSVLDGPMRVLFGLAIPVSFAGYLPTIELLGLPSPPWLPAQLAWFGPIAALWVWALALISWRVGVRHYQGGGG